MSLPHLDAAEIARRLAPAAAADALEAALRAGIDLTADPPRTVTAFGPGHQLLAMPSTTTGRAVVKLIAVGGDPRIQGICVAFDRETLAPAALLDGIALTNLRTAAVSALAVRHLTPPGRAVRLLVLGRGPQARAHVAAVGAEREIAHLDLLGRQATGKERDRAVAAADVVCCCTTAREPLFDGALVADHATVVAIGSHEPGARETDDALAARATVIVEDPATALREAGDVIQAIAAGALDPSDLVTLADLVAGPTPAARGCSRASGWRGRTR